MSGIRAALLFVVPLVGLAAAFAGALGGDDFRFLSASSVIALIVGFALANSSTDSARVSVGVGGAIALAGLQALFMANGGLRSPADISAGLAVSGLVVVGLCWKGRSVREA